MEEHKNMLRCFAAFWLSLFVFCSLDTSAQTIRLVRTDVDSGRASFITATQMFGVDVLVSGVKNCTGVSFELQYQGSKMVVFSNWKERELGRKGTFAYDLSDTSTGVGSVHIGALAGIAITDPGIDNPRAVHLDFVVRPDAQNATPISFTFVHAQAVTSDSGGRIVPLTSTTYSVVIHGFVNVFPGDADNNGVVDSRDATTVGSFLKQGSGSSNVRGYKREPCSTLWLPQPSLVWDSSKATYADCDGSGDVTLSDNLVVQINFGKAHSITKKINDIQQRLSTQFDQSLTRIPISIGSNSTLLGVALELQLLDPNARVVGFEPLSDDPDVQTSLSTYDEESRTAYIVFGDTRGRNIVRSGLVGYLVFEAASSPFQVRQALGATSDGRIFALGLSDIGQEEQSTNSKPEISYNQGVLSVGNVGDQALRLDLYTTLGQKCATIFPSAQCSTVDLSSLAPGMYMGMLTNQSGQNCGSIHFLR